MKIVKLLILVIVSQQLSGCLLLPIPHRKMEGYGISGRILDAETKKPVAGVLVTEINNDNRGVTSTRTDDDGNFRIKPHYQWHFGMIIGPLCHSIWPHTGCFPVHENVITIQKKNYIDRILHVAPEVNYSDNHPPKTNEVPAKVVDDNTNHIKQLFIKVSVTSQDKKNP